MRNFLCSTRHANRTLLASPRYLFQLRKSSHFTHFNRLASTLPSSPIFEALSRHDPSNLAVVHSGSGRSFTYGSLLHDVAAAKDHLGKINHGKSLRGQRVAFLAENGYDYVVTFLSILAHDAIALPLSQSLPSSELSYVLEDSGCGILLSTSNFQNKAKDILNLNLNNQPHLEILEKIECGATSTQHLMLDPGSYGWGGLMLYTSGTTNRPKGVVLSTSVMTAQARSLIEAWKYSPTDRLLNLLPLHHIHGVINALFTPLFAGSSIELAYPFNANQVWRRLASPFTAKLYEEQKPAISFLTAVPIIYSRLLNAFPSLSASTQEAAKVAISPQNLRLNISGSAALPTPLKSAWTNLSGGNILLERYGMTEVGMALSCGLEFEDRVDASVGWPLPSVEVRLVDVETNEVILLGEDERPDGTPREGEIQLRGPTVFTEYWNNQKATEAEFVKAQDGQGKWFKTGDIAMRRIVPGTGQSRQAWTNGPMYFIRGRKSVDIIKIGGEKVSALEIERELLSLPQIAEAAVVGLQSEQWGQKVAAVVVLTPTGKTAGRGGKAFGAMDMRRALKNSLANYKIPQELKIVDSIPRNAMGKINKKALIRELFP